MRTTLPLLLAALALGSGCQKSEPASPPAAAVPPAPAVFTPDPATAATVTGTVIFRGHAPAGRKVSMDAEPDCEKLHAGPVVDRPVETDRAGHLANVFVYVKSGLEGKHFAPPAETVVIEQKGCQFQPRVAAIEAGQVLTVRNSDPVSHSIHPKPVNNRDWNQQQTPGAADLRRKFARPEVMIPITCNIHKWMKSYLAVLDHPYFAVTAAADTGFTWPPLPPGDYVIAAWHETLGEKEQKITVGPKERVTVEFRYP